MSSGRTGPTIYIELIINIELILFIHNIVSILIYDNIHIATFLTKTLTFHDLLFFCLFSRF